MKKKNHHGQKNAHSLKKARITTVVIFYALLDAMIFYFWVKVPLNGGNIPT